jgi:drug/metabolite transporter (DMT)-like permease
LGYISPAKVTVTLLLQPVFTGLLAALLLHERLKDNQLLGGLIVLLGLAISFMEFKKKGNTHLSA